jgi:hypothetical protein
MVTVVQGYEKNYYSPNFFISTELQRKFHTKPNRSGTAGYPVKRSGPKKVTVRKMAER